MKTSSGIAYEADWSSIMVVRLGGAAPADIGAGTDRQKASTRSKREQTNGNVRFMVVSFIVAAEQGTIIRSRLQ
jgi:hypothetical protein